MAEQATTNNPTTGAEPAAAALVDVADFHERIVAAYNRGTAELELPALSNMVGFIKRCPLLTVLSIE